MRRTEKEQMENFIKTSGQAHTEIKKYAGGKKDSGISALYGEILMDIQQGAVELGNMIEKSGGKEGGIIPLLEEYCELVYRVYEKLAGMETPGVVKELEEMGRVLQLIKDETSKIIIHREVVFLPYKASMWDSMESIWMEASADESCRVCVVSVPYFDRHPDGSFGRMHDERDEYPEYVPITGYEDYNFQDRRPDIVFIHNPYDKYNYVTSVMPFYYSENLRKYTDCLIYVPYFILNEIRPEDHEAVAYMQHFCSTPGVMNADMVIVQSEDMSRIYANVMTDLCGEQDQYGKRWCHKIFGYGSPKVDKILRTKREDLNIPKEWMHVLCRPDGTWKKVVLYNTGVSSLLRHNESMLEKIKRVFETFKNCQNEIVLLWRPHPLIQATISAMRPGLWEEYKQIVAQYRKENWGIYDDTPDIHRAVSLSDAYYGDSSSVVWMCQKAGIPVMIQQKEC